MCCAFRAGFGREGLGECGPGGVLGFDGWGSRRARALSLLLAASVYIQEYQDEHMNGEMNISSSTDADLQVNKYKKT